MGYLDIPEIKSPFGINCDRATLPKQGSLADPNLAYFFSADRNRFSQ